MKRPQHGGCLLLDILFKLKIFKINWTAHNFVVVKTKETKKETKKKRYAMIVVLVNYFFL